MKITRFQLAFGLSLLILMGIAVFRCLDRGFNHDEHQFIVPATLMARLNLLPYRDFAFFHQPYSAFLNACIVKTGVWPFLTGRLVAGISGGGTLIALFLIAWFRSRGQSYGRRFLLAWAGVLLLLASPIYLRTSGRSWNHELPTFLALGAALLTIQNPASTGWVRYVLIGTLGGLSVGTWLTFAPFALMLAFTPWLQIGWSNKQKFASCAAVCLGTTVALLPSLWLMVQTPGPYLFGNFGYAAVPFMEGAREIASAPLSSYQKVVHFFVKVVPPDACLFIAVFCLGVPGCFRLWRDQNDRHGFVFLITAFLLLIGAYAPAAPHPQYFYTPMVFALASLLWAAPLLHGPKIWLLVLLAVVSLGWRGKELLDLNDAFRPKAWTVNRIHRSALKLREVIGRGKILTLHPVLPVEAGLNIYPELALGPFAWRCAELFPEKRQRELHLIGPDDLEMRLFHDPPDGILTGAENPKIEQAIIDYAQRHGYRKQPFEKLTLWLP